MKKILALILSAAMLLSVMAGCQKEEAPAQPETPPAAEEAAPEAAEKEPAAEETEKETGSDLDARKAELTEMLMEKANEVVVNENDVTFVDDSGREALTIAKNPKNVAVLYGSHACLWVEAGGTVSIGIGGKSASALYKEQIGRDIMEDEGTIMVSDSSSGKNWDVETILAEQPDLIICSTAMSGYETISAPAEAANIPVIALTYSGIGDYLRWFKVFSNLNGTPEKWDEVAQGVLDQVVDILAKVPAENNPTVLSLFPNSKGLSVNTSASDTGAMLAQMNAVNVGDPENNASAPRIEMSIEEIFEANPDYILIQCSGPQEEAEEKLNGFIQDSPVWASLDAVKEGRVHYLPKELFHYRPNHLYGESYKMLAELIYPDIEF